MTIFAHEYLMNIIYKYECYSCRLPFPYDTGDNSDIYADMVMFNKNMQIS